MSVHVVVFQCHIGSCVGVVSSSTRTFLSGVPHCHVKSYVCSPHGAVCDIPIVCTCNSGMYYSSQYKDCLRCVNGYYCPRGSTNITGSGKCPAGFYCSTGKDRELCRAGYYCPRGSTSITGSGQCRAGYYCPRGSESITGSGKCPDGYRCVPGHDKVLIEGSSTVYWWCGIGIVVLLCAVAVYVYRRRGLRGVPAKALEMDSVAPTV